MGDEIGSAAELFDVAELREVVMHHLGATCEAGPDAEALGLPPELLYAPGSPDEPMAMDLRSRVGGLELGVRIAVTTRNAYAAFWVDAEAVFTLPGPIAAGQDDIVQEFIEQVGGPALFPYIRATVASLAAQLSVPASPLPLLQSFEMELATDQHHSADTELAPDQLPPHPESDDEDRYVNGQIAKQTAVKIDKLGILTRTDEVCAFMIDTLTREVVQLGGETIVASEIDFIKQVLAMSDAEIDALAAQAHTEDNN